MNNSGPKFTIGVEEEYLLVDQASASPDPMADDALVAPDAVDKDVLRAAGDSYTLCRREVILDYADIEYPTLGLLF